MKHEMYYMFNRDLNKGLDQWHLIYCCSECGLLPQMFRYAIEVETLVAGLFGVGPISRELRTSDLLIMKLVLDGCAFDPDAVAAFERHVRSAA